MNWPDERYVRIYTRDTPEFLILSLEAQWLLWALLRKVDRSGVTDLGRLGKKSVAVLCGKPDRWQDIEPALQELLESGAVAINGTVLVIPNFEAAQTAAQSDKLRVQEFRARRREKALRNDDESDGNETGTPGNESLPDRNAEKRGVTRGYSVLSCTVPSQADPEEQRAADAAGAPSKNASEEEDDRTPEEPPGFEFPPPEGALPPAAALRPTGAPRRAKPTEEAQAPRRTVPPVAAPPREVDVTTVLTYWREASGMAGASIEGAKASARRKRILARLKEGFSCDQLGKVADGMKRDPWLMGTDPKSKPGGYRDVETVYRDAAQCERLIALADGAPARSNTGAYGQPVRSVSAPAPFVPYVPPEIPKGPPLEGPRPRPLFAPTAPVVRSEPADPTPKAAPMTEEQIRARKEVLAAQGARLLESEPEAK